VDILKDDPEDNKILEAALAGKADFIITGDAHLLKIKEFKSVKILNTKDFFNYNFN